MVNYYNVLRVSQNASRAEIRSAYRRLARRKHPDVNDGDASASREFTQIAKAYQVLSNPKERAAYDKQMLRETFASRDSVFSSDNPHARRARQMAYERRYNAIIDRMIEEERREAKALQKVIFPVVALFVSTIFTAALKPEFWSDSNFLGKIVIFTLFVIGVLHLVKRLQAGYERYTYSSEDIHDSILRGIEEENRPYSRISATSFLVGGMIVSILAGLLIRPLLVRVESASLAGMISETLAFELIFYPPIVVLLVDLLHTFATRFER
ncbi:MAG: J domain-containing protein [Aridibacter famidurans]|nr:J domain-containing protein [Aridibacter famidurans]